MVGKYPENRDFERQLGERIRLRRAALGWTQDQLAEACGALWDKNRISSYESGRVSMSIGAWHRIEEALREGERAAGSGPNAAEALGDLSLAEEQAVLEYIQFLKWRRVGRKQAASSAEAGLSRESGQKLAVRPAPRWADRQDSERSGGRGDAAPRRCP